MQIDLRTVAIKPLRQTYDHIAARFGDKPASRYQEATYDIQAVAHFHYRPLWDPDHEQFDPARTAIRMKDWYAFKDPRQYYYGTWTIARAKQQDAAEANFEMIEDRGLAALLPDELKKTALAVLVPLRHVEWGGNTNDSFMCAYGYGTAITQPCMYAAMDHLGMAQYLTRVGLELEGPAALDAAKAAWLNGPGWQGLRRYVEDSFVVQDWFELFVAQHLALEGLMFPLVFDTLDAEFSARGGTAISMMTRFMNEWYAETSKWVDAQIKVAAAESQHNKDLVSGWARAYRDKAAPALEPIAALGLGSKAKTAMDDVVDQFNARCARLGLTL